MKENNINFTLLDWLLFPVSVPAKGFIYLLEQIKELVDNELYNEGELKKSLIELEMLYEMNSIDEDEYRQLRSKIIERLKFIAMAKREGQEK